MTTVSLRHGDEPKEETSTNLPIYDHSWKVSGFSMPFRYSRYIGPLLPSSRHNGMLAVLVLYKTRVSTG